LVVLLSIEYYAKWECVTLSSACVDMTLAHVIVTHAMYQFGGKIFVIRRGCFI